MRRSHTFDDRCIYLKEKILIENEKFDLLILSVRTGAILIIILDVWA